MDFVLVKVSEMKAKGKLFLNFGIFKNKPSRSMSFFNEFPFKWLITSNRFPQIKCWGRFHSQKNDQEDKNLISDNDLTAA